VYCIESLEEFVRGTLCGSHYHNYILFHNLQYCSH